MQTIELTITGMTCGACRVHVENALASVAGAGHVEADIESATAVVHGKGIKADDLIEAVEKEGYGAQLKSKDTQ